MESSVFKVCTCLPDKAQKEREFEMLHQAENNSSTAWLADDKLNWCQCLLQGTACCRVDFGGSCASSISTSAHPVQHNPLQLAVSTHLWSMLNLCLKLEKVFPDTGNAQQTSLRALGEVAFGSSIL